MIIQFFDFYLQWDRHTRRVQIGSSMFTNLPGDFIAFGIVFKCNRKITAFVKFSKSSWFTLTYTCRKCWWWSIDLNHWNFIYSVQNEERITLAFFNSDLTVKPSVSKEPVERNRAFVSRRGEVATAITCCQLLESVSISHKWQRLSPYCFLTTTITKSNRQETILLLVQVIHLTTSVFFIQHHNELKIE